MVILLGGILLMSTQCSKKKTDPVTGEKISEMQQKVEEYAYFDLTTDISKLSENDKQLLPIFFEIGEIMDELFWEQTFGDKSILALGTVCVAMLLSSPAMARSPSLPTTIPTTSQKRSSRPTTTPTRAPTTRCWCATRTTT